MTNVSRKGELSNRLAIPGRTDPLRGVSSVKYSHFDRGEHKPFASIIDSTLVSKQDATN